MRPNRVVLSNPDRIVRPVPAQFNPLAPAHDAVVAYVRPNYAKVGSTGTYAATAGVDLVSSSGAPLAVGGAPDFSPTFGGYLTNAVLAPVWLGSLEDHQQFVVLDTTRLVPYIIGPGSVSGYPVWGDRFQNVGLEVFKNINGTMFALFYEWTDGGAASKFVQAPIATASTHTRIQTRKTIDGFLEMKVDGAEWVRGQACGLTDVSYGTPVLTVGGLPTYDPITSTLHAFVTYGEAKSNAFSNAVNIWGANL